MGLQVISIQEQNVMPISLFAFYEHFTSEQTYFRLKCLKLILKARVTMKLGLCSHIQFLSLAWPQQRECRADATLRRHPGLRAEHQPRASWLVSTDQQWKEEEFTKAIATKLVTKLKFEFRFSHYQIPLLLYRISNQIIGLQDWSRETHWFSLFKNQNTSMGDKHWSSTGYVWFLWREVVLRGLVWDSQILCNWICHS